MAADSYGRERLVFFVELGMSATLILTAILLLITRSSQMMRPVRGLLLVCGSSSRGKIAVIFYRSSYLRHGARDYSPGPESAFLTSVTFHANGAGGFWGFRLATLASLRRILPCRGLGGGPRLSDLGLIRRNCRRQKLFEWIGRSIGWMRR
jgi:hypothetical protein